MLGISKLVFKDSAKRWEEATPIGNGRLGAMVYGYPGKEVIQFNEETLWSGKPLDDASYDIRPYLGDARQLAEGKAYNKLEELTKEKMLGHWTQNYLPFGMLTMDFHHMETITDYHRELDMEKGILRLTYMVDGITFKRTYFISHEDDVLVCHIETDRIGRINCQIEIDSLLKHDVLMSWNDLKMTGRAPVHVDPPYDSGKQPVIYGDEGMDFAAVVKVETDGVVSANAQGLTVQFGTYMTVYMSCKTGFESPFTRSENGDSKSLKEAEAVCNNALHKNYVTILRSHVEDFSGLMSRSGLSFSATGNNQLIIKDAIGDDKSTDDLNADLIEGLFHFGKYLTISSSREGTYATNLQGIWNPMLQAPWCSNYTLNINTQMNYWPVDRVNLSECFEPLVTLVKDLSISGKSTAKGMGSRGWTANHNTDLWRQTVPTTGNVNFAFWPMSGPWLMTQLYDHYRFNNEEGYLRRIMPLLAESVAFALDWLYEDAKGYRVTAPSTSPENVYLNNNGKCGVTKASTMDMCIIWQLFRDYRDAMQEIQEKGGEKESNSEAWQGILEEVEAVHEKLYPYQIDSAGRIQEWFEEQIDDDEGHRHLSHLFGIFPGYRAFDEMDNEKLIEAHGKSLAYRLENGGGATSWSCAWAALIAARLRDSGQMSKLLKKFTRDSLINNGLSSHPPFQIDGNFGITAAIAEMLVHKVGDDIYILPALPSAIESGRFETLKVQGDILVSAEWSDGEIKEIRLKSKSDVTVSIHYDEKIQTVECQPESWVVIS